MHLFKYIFIILLASCGIDNMTKPNPKKIPYKLIQHNDVRIDNYYWMRDDSRTDKDLLAYLESENKYSDQWFDSKYDYKTEIVNELINQLPDEQISYPLKNGAYSYYDKLQKNEQLAKFYIKGPNNNEILYLDPNIKLTTQEYYSVSTIKPSPNNSYIAYLEDNNGRREYDIKILDSDTMEIIDAEITGTSRDIVWSNDNNYLIYSRKDPVTLINNSVFVHKIGTPSSEDILILKENDQEYDINLIQSNSNKYAYINIEATNQNEIYLINLKMIIIFLYYLIMIHQTFRF